MPTPDYLGEHLVESIAQPNGKWLWWPTLRGGVGMRYLGEQSYSLKERYGYVGGDVDTWDTPFHKPVLVTGDIPTSISGSKTDYACMAEIYIDGAWYVYLIKGTNMWRTTGNAFGAAIKTLTGAQGRQLLDCVLGTATLSRGLVWIPGSGANIQFYQAGGSWAQLTAGSAKAAVCGWNTVSAGVGKLFVVDSSGGIWWRGDWTSAWADTSDDVPILGATGLIPLGTLDAPGTYYFANGSQIWSYDGTDLTKYDTPLGEISSGCVYRDRFLISDGMSIIWTKPGQFPVDYSIWGKDGVPSDWAGSVKALMAVGDVVIAYYELDAGGTVMLWGRVNEQGEMEWHPRNVTFAGAGHPLSIGCPFVFARYTYSTSQRLWVPVANGSAALVYRQDYPKHSLNPLTDSAMQYAAGTQYAYLPHAALVGVGPHRGVARLAAADAELTSTETLGLAYRVDRPSTAEVGGSWTDVATLTDLLEALEIIKDGRQGADARAIQLRLALTRGGTATATPKVHGTGVFCEAVTTEERKRARRV